jgi:glycosyltransferase involved in cell wall biosynthesis
MPTKPRTALVHEWLVRWGGSESVLASLSNILPNAPIHTLVHRPDPRVTAAFQGRNIVPTSLSRVPGAGRFYPAALPIMPALWRKARTLASDLVISSSHSFCKGIDTGSATHICYCHTPPRYIWDLRDEYQWRPLSHLSKPLVKYLQEKDREDAHSVDHFIANSEFVAMRIRRIYGREAQVIYPPVDIDQFIPGTASRRHFLAGGRLVRYKRIDRAVIAATKASLPLIVFGVGPDLSRLKSLAGPTVQFVGGCSAKTLLGLMQTAIALIFPGIEDFGILPVEVQATGTPVVALAQGGANETVINGATGLLYEEDSLECLLDSLKKVQHLNWNVQACRRNANRFARPRFEAEINSLLEGLGFVASD